VALCMDEATIAALSNQTSELRLRLCIALTP
jgi:hypothetical protein